MKKIPDIYDYRKIFQDGKVHGDAVIIFLDTIIFGVGQLEKGLELLRQKYKFLAEWSNLMIGRKISRSLERIFWKRNFDSVFAIALILGIINCWQC